MNSEELTHRFTYHPPRLNQPEKYVAVRDAAKAYANLLNELVPEGREKSLSITKLEETVFWANAGIARGDI